MFEKDRQIQEEVSKKVAEAEHKVQVAHDEQRRLLKELQQNADERTIELQRSLTKEQDEHLNDVRRLQNELDGMRTEQERAVSEVQRQAEEVRSVVQRMGVFPPFLSLSLSLYLSAFLFRPSSPSFIFSLVYFYC